MLLGAAMLAAETAAALARDARRRAQFVAALARARALARPLIVVGDPGNGAWSRATGGAAYGCGDLVVDLAPSAACPRVVAHDLAGPEPTPGVAAGGAVVFCSCVLEYVPDPHAAWRELVRMAGDPAHVFLVAVDPGSFTAALYAGARWEIVAWPPAAPALVARRVSGATRALYGALAVAGVLL